MLGMWNGFPCIVHFSVQVWEYLYKVSVSFTCEICWLHIRQIPWSRALLTSYRSEIWWSTNGSLIIVVKHKYVLTAGLKVGPFEGWNYFWVGILLVCKVLSLSCNKGQFALVASSQCVRVYHVGDGFML